VNTKTKTTDLKIKTTTYTIVENSDLSCPPIHQKRDHSVPDRAVARSGFKKTLKIPCFFIFKSQKPQVKSEF